MSPVVEVTVYHLVMRGRPEWSPSDLSGPKGVKFRQVAGSDRAALTQTMYRRVGAAWSWVDRVAWSHAEWEALLAEVDAEVWVVESDAEPIGFTVLARRGGEDVELLYLGLVPEWTGRGIGKWLLRRALDQAWALGPARVRLETCSLDAPAALPNYLAHGFEVRCEERLMREVP